VSPSSAAFRIVVAPRSRTSARSARRGEEQHGEREPSLFLLQPCAHRL